jgi:protein-disulfide isomerase/uncharacterized membrane protein
MNMLKKTHLLAISICLSIILHAYLTNSFFQVHYGDGGSGNAICNVGEKFNCEAVSASSYSQFLGIPLATWGLGLNLTLFILLLGFLLSDLNSKAWYAGFQILILTSALSSVVMAFIAVSFLTVYCLFCIILYILSFAQVYLAFKDGGLKDFKENIGELLNFQKAPYSVFIALAMFPIISGFVGAKMKRDYGGDRFEKQIEAMIESWKAETNEVIFANTPATLVKSNSNAETTFEIVEFADFLCGHCQKASRTIKTFMAGHKASFRFYTFPLDQTCRTLENTMTGPSCYLAKTVYCADQQSLGWQAHDWIFGRQNEFMTTMDKVKANVQTMSSELGLSADKLGACIESEDTHKAIVTQSQFAQNLNITGTPTIYVNGKKLKGGQMLDVLKRAYDIGIDK